jgi:hypothetical protein
MLETQLGNTTNKENVGVESFKAILDDLRRLLLVERSSLDKGMNPIKGSNLFNRAAKAIMDMEKDKLKYCKVNAFDDKSLTYLLNDTNRYILAIAKSGDSLSKIRSFSLKHLFAH